MWLVRHAGESVGTLFSVQAAQSAASANGHAAAAAASTRDMAVRARRASRVLRSLPSSERVAILNRVADALLDSQDTILAENAKDVAESTVSADTTSQHAQSPQSAHA